MGRERRNPRPARRKGRSPRDSHWTRLRRWATMTVHGACAPLAPREILPMPNRCALLIVSSWLSIAAALQAQEAPRHAGPSKAGFVLPNGWVVSPAGEQVQVPDLPLNILPLPDGRHALVATSGDNAHELALVSLESKTVVDRQAIRETWFGLAASPDLARIWWSGGGGNVVHRLRLAGNTLTREGEAPGGDGSAGSRGGKTHFRS